MSLQAVTVEATVEAYAFGRRLAMPACPHCGETQVAPASAAFVGEGRVRHVWACDSCGYAFQTAVRYGRHRHPAD